MIVLKTLEWSNMFSYGENNFLDFCKYPITQLVGKNGHGKTSIRHVLEELLFNKNSKGYKKAAILNRNIKANYYSGKVTFDIDDVPYTIISKRQGATQKITLLRREEDISLHTATATYDLIEKLFKVDFKTSSQIIGQNSKSSLDFLTTTDTLRKKFLIDLLNYESYLEEYEKAKEVHKRECDILKTIEIEHKHLKEWISDKSKTQLDKILVVDEIEHPFDLEKKISSLTEEIRVVDKTTEAIRKNNQYIELRNSIPVEILVKDVKQVNLQELRSREAVLKAEITSAKAKITKIKKLHGKCTECLQDIDETFTTIKIDEATRIISICTDELHTVVNAIKEGTECNTEYDYVKKQVADFEKYSGLIDKSLPREEPNKTELANKLAAARKSYDEICRKRKEIQVHNESAKAHNTRVDLISSQMDEMRTKLTAVSLTLEKQIRLVNELEILKKAFSTNGLVAYKIENSVKELEDLTNKYLEELSDGRFQLFFIINNDKLNVVIKDDGISVDIEALSAGELSRVTTATLLAIRKLMATLSKSQINLLFLDETLDVLDEEGKEKLIDILVNETNLNTFLISHGYRHPLLQTVSVVKEKKISKLYDN